MATVFSTHTHFQPLMIGGKGALAESGLHLDKQPVMDNMKEPNAIGKTLKRGEKVKGVKELEHLVLSTIQFIKKI